MLSITRLFVKDYSWHKMTYMMMPWENIVIVLIFTTTNMEIYPSSLYYTKLSFWLG